MNYNKTDMIRITFPDGRVEETPRGVQLLELGKNHSKDFKSQILAAKVNNDIRELTYEPGEDCRVEFIDLTNDDGLRIYRRSLHFILIKAVYDLFPDRKVVINHSISKGIYCEIQGGKELDAGEVQKIEARMYELVREKIPFVKRMIPVDEAREIFTRSGRLDRFHVIEYRAKPNVTIYSCGNLDDYFYGYMVPDTGYLNKFSLVFYPPGLIMLFPEKNNPDTVPEFREQKKLFNIFHEYKKWGHILGVDNVGALNDTVKTGEIRELIWVSEALHEKKIARIADMIAEDRQNKRIVLISGPSSSGKTTFAHRLSIQLRVNGLEPFTVSTDDYFLDRDRTPKDENGEYDYEAIEAIDLKLFNENLSTLINGKETEIPVFNFSNGSRETVGRKLKIKDDQVLIIEGIHGLNERLTASVPGEKKFKIYVSALTSLNIDDHNRIPSTDTRIIRRIVRDNQFRGSDAVSTIKRWPSVRRGEEKYVFPFQETADVMFNSALIFELGVLKTFAEPLLKNVDNSLPEYSEAKRLIEFLSYILPVGLTEIPLNSIIREFIGGCCFYR